MRTEPVRTNATIDPNCPVHGRVVERKTPAEWDAHFATMLGVGSIVRDTPDPYRAATDAAPRQSEPTDDASYQPFGTAPNGYQLALARQKETR